MTAPMQPHPATPALQAPHAGFPCKLYKQIMSAKALCYGLEEEESDIADCTAAGETEGHLSGDEVAVLHCGI